MNCDKRIAFLCFSTNDNKTEQKRVKLSLESLCLQKYENYEIIFLDCSDINKRFILDVNERLKILYHQPTIWHPTYFRNYLSLVTNADILAYVNSDNVYSPLMASFINDKFTINPNLLLHCRRRDTYAEQFDNIHNIHDAYELVHKIHPRRGCAGDFQVISRNIFLKLGGYRGLIVNNKINVNTLSESTAFQEDAWLSVQAEQGCEGLVYERYSSLNPDKTINPNEKYWILHLWHPPRKTKMAWDKNFVKVK